MKSTVVIGLIGATLDKAGNKPARWERWRPSVALCQHEDLLITRFDLLYQNQYRALTEQVVADIATVAPETEVRLHRVEFDDPWDFEQVYATLHDFARSYAFDTDHEDYLIHITTGTHVAQICCYLLTEARYFPARLLQTSPLRERRSSQPGTYSIIDLDLSRYDKIASRFLREAEEGTDYLKAGIRTRDAAFNALIARIEQVALRSRAPVLLTGPTGAGKSQLARRIYQLKQRRNQISGRFVEVNCATLRGDAAMSALFGHQRGAFTGAARDREGLLRQADKGMLFLDEIGELGLDEQTMLLRALEEKRFLPLGSDREASSDFQLLAGTNRDLQQAVYNGGFREDLLARINLWTFQLPGLKDRRADIEPNLDYELERYARETGDRITFNREARQRYLQFALAPAAAWRANFRDLSASVTRLATLAPGGRITLELVAEEITRLQASWHATTTPGDADPVASLLPEDIDLFERTQLLEVIRVCRASRSQSEAGRRLFAVSRQKKDNPNDADRLRKYLSRFGLNWQLIVDTPE
jgi:transcriptional regulatory protein RtcR